LQHKLKGTLGIVVFSFSIILLSVALLFSVYSGGGAFETLLLPILCIAVILLLFVLHTAWQKLLWVIMFLIVIAKMYESNLISYITDFLFLFNWLVYGLIIAIAFLFLAIASRKRREARKMNAPTGRGPY